MSGRITRWLLRKIEHFVPRPTVPEHLVTGYCGEQEAYFYLRRCGYVVVARNWRSRRHRGEIDLIAWDAGVLCFVEVKTRTTRAVKPAEAAVDHHKQVELCAVARQYLRSLRQLPQRRFDIVSVYYEGARETAEITLFRNAFSMK